MFFLINPVGKIPDIMSSVTAPNTLSSSSTAAPQADRLPRQFYAGFDYLRAGMALAVIAWHLRIFGKSDLFDINRFANNRAEISDIITLYVLLLAVPIFFLISFYLFFEKAKTFRYFLDRLERLSYLYLFWVGLWIIFEGGFSYVSSNVHDLPRFFMRGGNSIFYYFFSLILLTCVAYLTTYLPRYALWLFLGVSVGVLGGMPLIAQYSINLVAYWNPLNFLPYVFIAALASAYIKHQSDHLFSRRRQILFGVLTILFIVICVSEWKWGLHSHNFKYDDMALPQYTRLSAMAGASILFLLSFSIRRSPGQPFKFFSDYSLGIYCLHPFVMVVYERLVKYLPTVPFAYTITQFLVVVAVSATGAFLLRRAFSRGLI